MYSSSLSTDAIRTNGNKLKDSASLYLRQHAHNPVYWYPWGDEAHQKAIETDKPVFLSVGYSSCHWCHVMEKGVFKNSDVAEYLNEHFICIKVDREEKPDVDAVYMKAVQAMTGSGGWPMSVFLTPDLKPFFGGTYYPKDAFINLANRIITLYRQDRSSLIEQATRLHNAIANSRLPVSGNDISIEQITSTAAYASKIFDETWGGFKSQMKFPTPSKWSFLLHLYRFNGEQYLGDMLTTTLDAIQDGGIHDHLAGGFHRYTVDPTWTVPHFEKMLYDNAQLASLFFEASVVFKNEDYRQTAESILDFLNKEMSGTGGFYASFDADSEGEEGVFYVWSKSEIEAIAKEDSAIICDYFGITNHGNFERKNVLTISSDLETLAIKYRKSEDEIQDILSSWINKLLQIRKKRVSPTLDKKVVLSWNALTISALVKGYRTTGKLTYLEKAKETIEFIYNNFVSGDGSFFRTYSNGKHEGEAVLDDYAFLADSLIDLFEVTGNNDYLDKAKRIVQLLKSNFVDQEGGFYFTHRNAKAPMGRQREIFDNVEPSGNSIVLKVFHRLGWLYFDQNHQDIVSNNLKKLQDLLDRAKLDMASTYDVALMQHLKYYSLVMAVDSIENKFFMDLLKTLPANCIVIPFVKGSAVPNGIPGLDEKIQVDNQPTAYLCDFGSCLEPFTEFEKLAKHLI